MSSFSALRAGDQGRVVGFNSGSKANRHQLLAMGLTRGTEFRVVRAAPLGDPLQIQVRDFDLSLRKAEGNCLKIEKI